MVNSQDYREIFKALSSSKRLKIVDMLSHGELCACMILDILDMSQSTLSHHMKTLCESGLINSRSEGKWIYYSLNKGIISNLEFFFNTIATDIKCRINIKDANCCKGCEKDE